MSIVSLQFIGFVAVTSILYYFVSTQYRWIILLVASICFYLSYDVRGLIFLFATAILSWYAAQRIQIIKDDEVAWNAEHKASASKELRQIKRQKFKRQRSIWVSLSVFASIFALFMCKYYGHLAQNINVIFNTDLWTAENIILPLGISYYSLQLISYVVDVSRDVIRAEKNPLKVCLYGVFFLSIMQGPFNRYNNLMPQICVENKSKVNSEQFHHALLHIVGGYIKKKCIADQVGLVANEVFKNFDNYSGLAIFLGVLCFAIQLYADFSGYMDIVIGIGEILGIKIPENFNQPFFAKSIQEFWQRWHITLGDWLKDYVFYPLLKSKSFKQLGKRITERYGKEMGRTLPTYLGMLILWTLIGVWHGAGFNYVFGVGILQFIYIVIGEVTKSTREKLKRILHINEDEVVLRIIYSSKCTILMMLAWVFFKASSFSDALNILARLPIRNMNDVTSVIAVFNGTAVGLAGTRWQIWLIYIVLCMTVLFLLDSFHEHHPADSITNFVLSKPYAVRLAFYLLLIFTLIIFGAYGSQYNSNNFIYFDF